MPQTPTKVIRPAAVWVLLCAYLSCAGWILSLLHQLNAVGYGVVILAGAIGATIWLKRCGPVCLEGIRGRNFRKRFRHWLPLGTLALATLTFLGGALHPPTNYDALAYRVPRILNWLAESRWHWIPTEFQRLNVRATGIEWVSAPLIALTRSDRLLFLINTVSFLLLPGLVFGVFTRLGVRRRAAWHWMWLMPTGYCFLLQAGSIGNDLFGAVFALAALDFALRAKNSGKITDVWLACIAAALLTGGKSSNFPLLLPIGIALLPGVPLMLKRLVPTMAVAVFAAGASFLPTAVLNIKYCGDWSGNKAEQAAFLRGGAALHVMQNTILLVEQNLVPPIFPMAGAWNKLMVKIYPPELMKKLEEGFEPEGAHLAVGELAMEEEAGLGFGVSVLLLLGFVGTRFTKSATHAADSERASRYYRYAILGGALVALLPYMIVSGSSTPSRLLTPGYCLVVPIFLLRQSGDWIRRNAWWRGACVLVMLLAAALVVISPARPLWPAQTILARLSAGNSGLIKRAASVYGVYANRAFAFAPLAEALPPDASAVGFIGFDEPETSLWKPFGSRRIVHISATDSLADARNRGVSYILAGDRYFATHSTQSLSQWRETNHLELVRTISLTLRASSGPSDWLILKVPPANGKNP